MKDQYHKAKFPFYGLKSKPYSVRQQNGRLFVQKTKASKEVLVDNTYLDGDHFIDRSFQIDDRWIFQENVFETVDELVFFKIRWGLNYDGEVLSIPYDPVQYLTKDVVVTKVSGNTAHFDEFPNRSPIVNAMNIPVATNLYATLQLAASRWRVKAFYSYDIEGRKQYV